MAKEKEYHVYLGELGAFIYAGEITADGKRWAHKSEVTDEAINAVRDYMVEMLLGGYGQEVQNRSKGYAWRLNGGREVHLDISIIKAEKNDEVYIKKEGSEEP